MNEIRNNFIINLIKLNFVSHMFNIGAVAPRGSNLFGLGDDETDGWDGERSYICELEFSKFREFKVIFSILRKWTRL